ncbi:MAG: hypothetical protein ABEJ84_01320 [Halodesulfurarchaeum sp.]
MSFRELLAWVRSAMNRSSGAERTSDLEPATASERAVKAPYSEIEDSEGDDRSNGAESGPTRFEE